MESWPRGGKEAILANRAICAGRQNLICEGFGGGLFSESSIRPGRARTVSVKYQKRQVDKRKIRQFGGPEDEIE